MILVDANLLLYAEDAASSTHQAARAWWDERLSGTERVCLSWPVLGAFIRIGTNPRVFQLPLSLAEATARVQSWLEQTCVRLVAPTERHWILFQRMLIDGDRKIAVRAVPDDQHYKTRPPGLNLTNGRLT